MYHATYTLLIIFSLTHTNTFTSITYRKLLQLKENNPRAFAIINSTPYAFKFIATNFTSTQHGAFFKHKKFILKAYLGTILKQEPYKLIAKIHKHTTFFTVPVAGYHHTLEFTNNKNNIALFLNKNKIATIKI